MAYILGQDIDLLILSIFSAYGRGRVNTYMTTILQEIIDELPITTFHVRTDEKKKLTRSFNMVITEMMSTSNGWICIPINRISVKCSGSKTPERSRVCHLV
ncbi:hypothetical protein Y032_0036g3154 [Ancylostoma ceylanicum]|uniref:Uncharacterized protein n=1 Tax=Ancylostoma ceylanicum TaxID=53326 RepID=A0A016UKM1_9BILA|nr:hypothetical protein Y032_0036g3154 [Ancylostoma ceylanicum]